MGVELVAFRTVVVLLSLHQLIEQTEDQEKEESSLRTWKSDFFHWILLSSSLSCALPPQAERCTECAWGPVCPFHMLQPLCPALATPGYCHNNPVQPVSGLAEEENNMLNRIPVSAVLDAHCGLYIGRH